MHTTSIQQVQFLSDATFASDAVRPPVPELQPESSKLQMSNLAYPLAAASHGAVTAVKPEPHSPTWPGSSPPTSEIPLLTAKNCLGAGDGSNGNDVQRAFKNAPRFGFHHSISPRILSTESQHWRTISDQTSIANTSPTHMDFQPSPIFKENKPTRHLQVLNAGLPMSAISGPLSAGSLLFKASSE